MRRRRNRFLREDVLAPWLTLLVILGLWWLGANALGPGTSAREAPLKAAPTISRPGSGVPPLLTGRDPEAGDVARASDDVPSAGNRPLSTPTDAELLSPEAALARGEGRALREKHLAIPVAGIQMSSLRSSFDEVRGSGRRHEAMDILAPRGAPVVAAIDGRIVKLFTSVAGGLTIYQFDPEEEYCYYYAHLDRYAAGLSEGQTVKRGETIGSVGTTGNAPPATPHLHFAIFKLGADKRWWDGTPIDPYLVFR